jgi:hypothetical protein
MPAVASNARPYKGIPVHDGVSVHVIGDKSQLTHGDLARGGTLRYVIHEGLARADVGDRASVKV